MKLCHACSADVRYCGHDADAVRLADSIGAAQIDELRARRSGHFDAAVFFQNLEAALVSGQMSPDDAYEAKVQLVRNGYKTDSPYSINPGSFLDSPKFNAQLVAHRLLRSATRADAPETFKGYFEPNKLGAKSALFQEARALNISRFDRRVELVCQWISMSSGVARDACYATEATA